jgi:hypothetical protein
VFAEIREAKPKRLYIAADGPRTPHPTDSKFCHDARLACSKIDWDCTVETLFRDDNLGCRRAISSAIDWFFRNESEGIILEDDCLPSQSFFRYCSELLSYYRDDEQIMCISGNNFQQARRGGEESYYFSRYPHCWGWATWRRAWAFYDASMDNWETNRNLDVIRQWPEATEGFRRYWENVFDLTVSGKMDSWAIRWLYSCWKRQGLSCLPHRNLVKNIGFTEGATHTTEEDVWYSKIDCCELPFPLKHPALKQRDIEADRFTDRNVYGIDAKPAARKNKGFLNKLGPLVKKALLWIKSAGFGGHA